MDTEKGSTNKKIWFRRKRYGWGWLPVSWQGWLVIVVYVTIIMRVAIHTDFKNSNSGSDALLNFAVPWVIWTTVLIIICYAKGEPPRWQWGKRKIDEK